MKVLLGHGILAIMLGGRILIAASLDITPPSPNRSCISLKPLQRPKAGSAVILDRVLEHCVNIHAAASCLQYLDINESDYLSSVSAANKEQEDTWTSKPLGPQPEQLYYDSLMPMLYHTVSAGIAFDRVDIMTNSFLYTQPLDRAMLVVWFLSEADMQGYSEHSKLRRSGHVQLRHFAAEENDRLTELKSEGPAPGSEASYELKVAMSDQIRIVLLMQYGGIWVDSDTVFLRDMSPLWPYEFACRWSFTQSHNNAVLRIFTRSELGRTMWEQAKKTGKTTMQPHTFATLLEGSGHQLLALPSPLVDPSWLVHDNIPQDSEPSGVFPFRAKHSFFSESVEHLAEVSSVVHPCIDGALDFFEGAFTYHWSSSHDNTRNDEGTYFQTLQNILADFVAGKQPNRYGEMFASSSM